MTMIIRSIIFNIVYVLSTFVIGVIILPSLLLPRAHYGPFIRLYFRWVYTLEKNILNLDYAEIGRTNIPAIGSYIIAMKHQSAYETLKLPLLFERPVVILKRELLMIPFWGWYAWKAGNIGINRNDPRRALDQIRAGVKRALDLGATPVIFPQGTRVAPTDTPAVKPYKRGIYEMYRETGASVVPVAVNSGLFWARLAFLKRPGVVTFQYLPAIPPGLNRFDFMARLEQVTETASIILAQQAFETGGILQKRSFPPLTPGIIAFLNIGFFMATVVILMYTALWFYGQSILNDQINIFWNNAKYQHIVLTEPRPRVTGFPKSYHIKWSGTVSMTDAQFSVPQIDIYVMPLLSRYTQIQFKSGFKISSAPLKRSGIDVLEMNALTLDLEIPRVLPVAWTKPNVQMLYDRGVIYRIRHFSANGPVMKNGAPVFTGSGTLQYDANLQPDVTMDLVFENPNDIRDLMANHLRHPMGKSFITGAIDALTQKDRQGGDQKLPMIFRIRDEKIYMGPFKIGTFGHIYWPVR